MNKGQIVQMRLRDQLLSPVSYDFSFCWHTCRSRWSHSTERPLLAVPDVQKYSAAGAGHTMCLSRKPRKAFLRDAATQREREEHDDDDEDGGENDDDEDDGDDDVQQHDEAGHVYHHASPPTPHPRFGSRQHDKAKPDNM